MFQPGWPPNSANHPKTQRLLTGLARAGCSWLVYALPEKDGESQGASIGSPKWRRRVLERSAKGPAEDSEWTARDCSDTSLLRVSPHFARATLVFWIPAVEREGDGHHRYWIVDDEPLSLGAWEGAVFDAMGKEGE